MDIRGAAVTCNLYRVIACSLLECQFGSALNARFYVSKGSKILSLKGTASK